VLLKNVHIAPSWLLELEKQIYRLNPHSDFRLFMTMEFQPNIPCTLLKSSLKIVYEQAHGIKASLQRAYKTLFLP